MEDALTAPASTAALGTRRVPVWKRVAYGTGALGDFFIFALVNVMLVPIYVVALKFDPRLVALAAALPRLVGVVSDPIAGAISDGAFTRWGRRRPFFVCGAIGCGLLMPFIWFAPAQLGQGIALCYLVVVLILFQAVYSFFSIPYGAMGYELSSDPDERTRILAWCPYMITIGSFLAPWFYWFSLRPVFQGNELVGVRWMSIVSGILVVGCGMIPALVFRQQAARQPSRAATTGGKVKVLEALLETGRSRAFLLLLGAMVLVTFGVNCQGNIILYINIFHMFGGDKAAATQLMGIAGTAIGLANFIILPAITRLSTLWGKRSAMLLTLGMCALGGVASWWTLSPQWPYLMLVSALIGYGGMTASNLMIASMTADVCDEDELRTGSHRAGAFASAMGATLKATMTVMILVGGYLPAMAGYTDLSVPPNSHQLLLMRLQNSGVQLVLPLIGMVLIWFYPLTKARSAEIRRLIEERRTRGLLATSSGSAPGGGIPGG